MHSIILEDCKKPPALPIAEICVFDVYKGAGYKVIPGAVPIKPVTQTWIEYHGGSKKKKKRQE